MFGNQSGKQSGSTPARTTSDLDPRGAIGAQSRAATVSPLAIGQTAVVQANGLKVPEGTQVTVMSIAHPRARVSWSQDGTATTSWLEIKDLAPVGASTTAAPAPAPTSEATPTDVAPTKQPPPPVNRETKPTLAPTIATPAPTLAAPAPTLAPAIATPAPAPTVSTGAPEVDGVIAPLYANGNKPTAADITAALNTHYNGDHGAAMNDPAFAGALMTAVGTHSGSKLHENIQDVAEGGKPKLMVKSSAVFKANWTLRHYTKSDAGPPAYNEIKSTAELGVDRLRRSPDGKSNSNTNNADWAQIGNVGYTFYLLCIDGQVPPRKFLSNCTHFAEYDFASIPSMFVSGDMLGATSAASHQHASGAAPLRGSGTDVKTALCNQLMMQTGDVATFLKALDQAFGVNFEVKVPGKLPVADGAWQQKA